MIKQKRGRNKLTIQQRAWDRIHDPLQDILAKMVHYKANTGYIKVAYGGYMQDLKKACIRILNTISSYEDEERKRGM